MMRTEVELEYRDGVAHLTLRPPEGKPPTLDHAVIARLDAVCAEVEARAGTLAAVVLQSASARHFCAGANLEVMRTITAANVADWVHRGHRLMNRLEALPLPVVAAVEGYALGGGLELAMACDLIFAADTARLGQTEVKLGLVTGWGGCHRLARRVGLARAKELAFSARLVEAGEAARIGLVDWAGPAADLPARVREFTAAVAANSRAGVRETKAILAACAEGTLAESADTEAAASARCLTDGDAPARLAQFFAARRPAPSPPA
jgi:enoyl-CoA hydratase